MTLREQVYEDLKSAMKAQDHALLGTVRYIWSEIKRVEIDTKHELSDDEVIELLRREVKRRTEAVEQMRQGGREELAHEEERQLIIINHYLPQLMSKEEVEKVVDEIIANGTTQFGAVMGQAMGKLKGKADGTLVSQIVKERLM